MNRLKKDIYRPITRHLRIGGWTQRMSSLQGSPQPLAFQYSGLGPAPLPPLEVAVLGHHPFYGHLPSLCWLSGRLCVSLNRLNYLTERDIDEKTFMCVKTCWNKTTAQSNSHLIFTLQCNPAGLHLNEINE